MLRFITPLAILCFAALFAADAAAGTAPWQGVRVAVGSVVARDGNPETAGALRSALKQAIAATPDIQLADIDDASHVLRGSVELNTRSPRRIDCSVSLLLSQAHSGTLTAVLSGKRSLMGPRASQQRGARDALDGAVAGAVNSLRDSLVAPSVR